MHARSQEITHTKTSHQPISITRLLSLSLSLSLPSLLASTHSPITILELISSPCSFAALSLALATPGCDPNAYQSIDGTCNNLEHPTWGSTFDALLRKTPAVYVPGTGGNIFATDLNNPSPRLISNTVGDLDPEVNFESTAEQTSFVYVFVSHIIFSPTHTFDACS
jgi:hypothetical protein